MTFGIQPKHIELIEQEAKRINSIPVGGNVKPDSCIYSYWFWKRIGEQISWDAATIALSYLKYLNKKDEEETKEVFKTLQQENEDLKKEVKRLNYWMENRKIEASGEQISIAVGEAEQEMEEKYEKMLEDLREEVRRLRGEKNVFKQRAGTLNKLVKMYSKDILRFTGQFEWIAKHYPEVYAKIPNALDILKQDPEDILP